MIRESDAMSIDFEIPPEAKAVRARIVLISRTSLPVRSEWDSWLRDHSAQDRTTARLIPHNSSRVSRKSLRLFFA